MTHYRKRCVHCHTSYSYQGSGDGCFNPLNDDRYCPECMKRINKALKDVPEKFHKEFIPIIPDTIHKPLTIEEFDAKYAEWKKEDIIHLYPVIFMHNIRIEDLHSQGARYRKWIDRKTGEGILTVEYEVDSKTNEVTGLW